jgi:hypothetical protein
MDSLFSFFLLFVAAIVALLTYMFVPYVPVVVLTSASAIALAAGVWWHWTQFSQEYRTSTWQEQLRNYASYVLVLLVILISYGFYVLIYSGSSLQEIAGNAALSVRNATLRATTTIAGGVSRAATAVLSEADDVPVARNVSRNVGINRNKSANFLV